MQIKLKMARVLESVHLAIRVLMELAVFLPGSSVSNERRPSVFLISNIWDFLLKIEARAIATNIKPHNANIRLVLLPSNPIIKLGICCDGLRNKIIFTGRIIDKKSRIFAIKL